MTDPGAASLALEREVTAELRRQGIVVWLDKDSAYTAFVDGLVARHAANEFPHPVVGFRGSFLELLMKLEPYGNALDKHPLLVHMPGHNEDSIKRTPVLELYTAGARFRKGLPTLIREAASGQVAPAEIERFVATDPTLEQADAWLRSAVDQSASALAMFLDAFGAKMLIEALVQPNSQLSQRVTATEEEITLRAYVHKLSGMDDVWRSSLTYDEKDTPLSRELHAFAAWVLSVEYVHDLKRAPTLESLRRLQALTPSLVRTCCDLASQLRRDHGDAYEVIAREVGGALTTELSQMAPEDLGDIDTFREEAAAVLDGAIRALAATEWAKAAGWCSARQGERSFWIQRDQQQRWEWALAAEAAEYGVTLTQHARPLAQAKTLEHAAAIYADTGYKVDRAQRRFEQKRIALMDSRLPHFAGLQEVAIALKHAYRKWADQMAIDFAKLCTEHGFLPPATLQQRGIYEQVVHPLTLSGDKVAVFVIDAFRYEMATELVDDLKGKGSGTVVDLKPRFAELPTITSVGMNVLAPVAVGERLQVAGVFQGFKTGEFTVKNPETRARAMGQRTAGKKAVLLTLSQVCEMPTAKLTKDVKPHQLVVVHSKEIDDAGEANMGLPTFDATLRQIKAAWHHLQLAGVKNFVFTADHGFLLQDETTLVQPYGKKTDPQRRHVIDDQPRRETGMVNVSMSSLGYDGIGGYLLFREDTAVFATGNAGASFVHGGNSPQERIIPVLTVTRKRVEQVGHTEYVVEVETMKAVLGLHRVRVRVMPAAHSPLNLGFAGVRAIDLALRIHEQPTTRAILKEASGAGTIKAGRLQVSVGDEWTEVFFGLEGEADSRARVEVYHPDNIEKVVGATPEQWYAVVGSLTRTTPAASPTTRVPTTPPQAPVGWADTIADEGVRKVFLHIEKHGAITEPEITTLLGSPRAFRRFSVEFDAHLEKLPFRVRIEPGDGGKRYVREGSQ